jgi:hypothetical protein
MRQMVIEKSQDQRLESVLNTVLHWKYFGGLVKWIQDFKNDFTKLALAEQKTWNNDEIKKLRFFQNVQNIGLVETIEEKVIDRSFMETCLRSHATKLDQKN